MGKAKGKRVLMLLENHFPQDVRVRQEAYKLIEHGYEVSVIGQYLTGDEPFTEVINGVKVYRLPLINLFTKGKSSKYKLVKKLYRALAFAAWILEYLYFTIACFWMSVYVWVKDGFDVIHHHNPPNTLWTIAAFYKIFGKKYIFDQHDLSPQLFLSKFKLKRGGLLYWMLLLEEKICLYLADMIIATNESYKRNDLENKFVKPESVFVVRNGPNLDKLKLGEPSPELLAKNKKILAYLGVMGPQDGVDYMIRALKELKDTLGRDDFYCVIIGHGDSVKNLNKYKDGLGLDGFVEFKGYLPYKEWIPFLSATDVCLEPNPSSPFNDLSTCVKVLEYMALKKSIVSFDLHETRYSAGEASLYAKPNEELDFAKKIEILMDDPAMRKEMGEVGYKRITDDLAWVHVSKNLIAAYSWLFDKK